MAELRVVPRPLVWETSSSYYLRQWVAIFRAGDGLTVHATNTLPSLHAGEVVDYRRLQSLASRYPGLVVVPVKEPKNGKGKSGGGEPRPDSQQSPNQADRTAPAKAPTLQFPNPSPAKGGGYTGGRQSIIWRPWPMPSATGVARARRLLTALYEEATESGRETAPVRWNRTRLAVGSRQGRIEQARMWEEHSLPRLLLAVDNSGSIHTQVDMLRQFACEVAMAVPWLLVMAAPNGEPTPLEYDGRRVLSALLNGKNWSPPGVRPMTDLPRYLAQWCAVRWPAVAKAANVVGTIYVGDFEDDFLKGMPGRRASISIEHSKNLEGRPQLAWGKEASNRPWPYIVGVGDEAGALTALEMALAEWKRGRH